MFHYSTLHATQQIYIRLNIKRDVVRTASIVLLYELYTAYTDALLNYIASYYILYT